MSKTSNSTSTGSTAGLNKATAVRLSLAAVLAILLAVGMFASLRDTELPPESYTQVPGSKAKHYFITFDVELGGGKSVWLRIEEDNCYLRLRADAARLLTTDALDRRPCSRNWPMPEAARQVRIIRRNGHLTAFVNGSLIGETFLPREPGGPVAVAVPENAAVENIRFQKIDTTQFTDGFMRQKDDDSGNWEPSGDEWKISYVKDTSRSANPFRCIARSDALSTRLSRRSFWGAHRVEASAATFDDGTFGLCALYRGDNDQIRLQWNGPEADPPDCIRLISVSPQGTTVLSEKTAAAVAGQWYSFSISVCGSELVAKVDGIAEFKTEIRRCSGGRIGLIAGQTENTRFDDVHVENSFALSEEEFEPGATVFARRCSLGEDGGMLYLAGCDSRRDFDFAAQVEDFYGKAGLAFGVTESVDGSIPAGYAFVYDPYANEAQLVELRSLKDNGADGEMNSTKPLGKVAMDSGTGPVAMAVYTEGPYVRCSLGGQLAIESYLDAEPDGRVGLVRADDEEFTNIRLTFREPPEPIDLYSETFENEKEMENWASLQSSWTAKGSRSHPDYWHKADFFGDHSVAVNVPVDGKHVYAGVAICCNGRSAHSGYRLALSKEGGGKAIARLIRLEKTVNSVEFTADGPVRLKLARRGSYVIAHANDRLVAALQDTEPLNDTRLVVWGDRKDDIDLHKVDIRCRNIRDFMFSGAPAGWVVGGGEWEVTNRWKCDPRWSWLGGGGEGVAALWTTDRYRGDFTAEFFAAFKMRTEKGGLSERYPHPGDINVSVCTDGRNFASGYSFIYSGWDGDWTRILRKEKIVAGSSRFRVEGYFHRRWFHIKVRRRGKRVELYIDDELARAFVDPKPLEGGHIALWSFVNKLMIARVRICAEDVVEAQHPLATVHRSSFEELDPPEGNGDTLLEDSFDTASGHFADYEGEQHVDFQLGRRDESDGYLKVVNRIGGGAFAAEVNCGEYSVDEYPIIEFDYCINAGAKINLYIVADNRLHCIRMNAPTDTPYQCRQPGRVDDADDDGQWRHARLDARKLFGEGAAVRTMFFGCLSTEDYLLCGFGGNHAGSEYGIDNFTITK